jgi:ABC-2 type transport system permease protein
MGETVARLVSVDRREALVETQAGTEEASQSSSPAADFTRQLLTLIMGGMMVFYAFFTGANSVQSILEEEEKGTLGRTFTTPVPVWCVLGGKFLAAGLTVLVQVALLMLFGALVFGIQWGSLAAASIAGLGLVLASATAGIFLVSLLQNRNQTGIIFGGVMTLTGMVGIFSVFTQGAYSSRITETVALVVPQGWAMTLLRRAVEGATPLELAPFLLGVLGWSVVFFGVGVLRFRRRYG